MNLKVLLLALPTAIPNSLAGPARLQAVASLLTVVAGRQAGVGILLNLEQRPTEGRLHQVSLLLLQLAQDQFGEDAFPVNIKLHPCIQHKKANE